MYAGSIPTLASNFDDRTPARCRRASGSAPWVKDRRGGAGRPHPLIYTLAGSPAAGRGRRGDRAATLTVDLQDIP